MSFKKFAQLMIASVVAIGLAAAAILFQNMLPLFLKVFLGLCLTALLLWAAYLARQVWHKLKLMREAEIARELENERNRLANERDRQVNQIASERWQVERDALLLAQQHAATRIYPDQKGYMPVLVSLAETGAYQYLQLPHPAHQARLGQPRTTVTEDETPLIAGPALPTEILYEQIASQIPAGHSLMGVSGRGVVTKEFAALKTMLISGGSDSGKSNTLAIKIDEAMRLGRNTRMIVIDWHAYKKDSLTKKIKAYEDRFLLPVVTEEEDTVPVLKRFLGWYQQRRRELKEASEQGLDLEFDDILLVCDEVPEMLDSGVEELREILTQVAKICGRSARGFGLFGWFVCQNMVGAACIRNYAHTIIGHKAVMLNEQKMVANGHTEIMREMDQWPRGRVVVYGQSFQGTEVLQMPFFTPPVVNGSAEVMEPLQKKPLPTSANDRLPNSSTEERITSAEDNGEASGRRYTAEDLMNPLVLKKFLNEAGKMRLEGKSIDAILRHFGMSPGGRNNQNLKALLDAQDEESLVSEG